VIQPFLTLPAADTFTTQIIYGPGGDLWVGVSPIGNSGAPAIDRIGLNGSVTSFVVPGNVLVDGLAAGQDGNVWFIADTGPDPNGNGQVLLGDVTPAGQVTEFPPIPLSAGEDGTSFDAQLISGPGGDVWFSYDVFAASSPGLWPVNQDFIGRVTAAGAITLFPVSSDSGRTRGLYSLAAGADGDLYFTQQIDQYFELERISQGGVVSRVTIPGLAPALTTQVTRGSGRSLTVIPENFNVQTKAIFRISKEGVVVRSNQIRASHLAAFGQVLEPADGSLWFTNVTGRQCLLGQISAQGAATVRNLSGTVLGRQSQIQSIAGGPDGELYLLAQDDVAYTVYRLSPGKVHAGRRDVRD
jgi:streptogramin lyase